MGYKGWMRGIIILASCKHHFIRVHEYLVQHPSNKYIDWDTEQQEYQVSYSQVFRLILRF